MTVRVPVEAAEAGRIERRIVHAWLDRLHPPTDGGSPG